MSNLERNNVSIIELFESKPFIKICAPMVRYSKIQFRNLVKEYNCDLCYTPMILADSFCMSSNARNNEFTTNQYDLPVIAQFAANTVHDFVGAAHLISPYCDGVDLNCGCPQRWAKAQGLGCILLDSPEIVCDIVKQCRNQIPKPFTVSIKMRILKQDRDTVETCRQFENAGVSFIAVHARTSSQLTGKINVDILKLVKENVSCPIVANGSLKNLEDCNKLIEATNVNGVMIANAILSNPALYSGYKQTPTTCIQRWVDICYNTTLREADLESIPNKVYIRERPRNLTFQCFHHHLVFMLESILPRWKRRVFNNYKTFAQVLDFLDSELNIRPKSFSSSEYDKFKIKNLDFKDRDVIYKELRNVNEDRVNASISVYDTDMNDGKYFGSKSKCDESLEEFNICNIFENG